MAAKSTSPIVGHVRFVDYVGHVGPVAPVAFDGHVSLANKAYKANNNYFL